MAVTWREVKTQLEEATGKLALECPDEIKRFHYGLITHSDAGKYAYDQYLGHFVHLYGTYFALSDYILPSIGEFARDPDFSLDVLKRILRRFTFTEMDYAGQYQLAEMAKRVMAALDSVQTKEDFIQLLKAWSAYFTRCYWWLHWYFPWGAGPAVCPRRSVEDVKEMARLVGLEVKQK